MHLEEDGDLIGAYFTFLEEVATRTPLVLETVEEMEVVLGGLLDCLKVCVRVAKS